MLTSRLSHAKSQATTSTCHQGRKNCFNTNFQESGKRGEQQQEMCHLIVSPRLSALELEILPSLSPQRLLLLIFNVFSLLKEKSVSPTKSAVDFWWGSVSLKCTELIWAEQIHTANQMYNLGAHSVLFHLRENSAT